jgi:low temperature requirement protein LtrA
LGHRHAHRFCHPDPARKLHSQLAPHAVHLPERFALFALIVLGESISGVVSGLIHQQWSLASAVTAMLGPSLAFSLWWVYFDNIDASPIRAARTGGHIWIYQTSLYAHLPLVIGLTTTAVGVQYTVISPQDLALPPDQRWLLCGGVDLVLVSLGLIHLTTVLPKTAPRNFTHVIYHFGTAAVLIILGTLGTCRPLILIGILALACAVQVVREVLGQLRAD